MAIFLTADSKILIQGITGGEGRKHGARMLAAGAKVVGGTNPKKAGTTVELNGRQIPVFATVKETMAATGADVSVIFVPAAGTKAAVLEAIDAEIPLAIVITEGIPVTIRPSSGRTRSRRATRPGSSGRTAPASPPPASRTRGSSRPTSRRRARSVWCPSPER